MRMEENLRKVKQWLKARLSSFKQELKQAEFRKKIGLRLGILTIVILLLPKLFPFAKEAVGYFLPPEPQAPFEADAVVVQSDVLENRIFSTGDILAVKQINLNVEQSGRVVRLNLDEGAEVGQGQLLVKINDKDLQARMQRAEFNLSLTREREKRQNQLLSQGGISQEEYDGTLGELKSLEAELALIQAEIEKTEIRAPFDGTLGLRYITEGSYITPSTRIASLQDLSQVYVDFSIPERYAGQVTPGDSIFFTIQGRERVFPGKVYAVEPRIDTNTRTIGIRAISDNPDKHLNPGALANVELVLERFDSALSLPSIALIPYEKGYKVYCYRQGKVHAQNVETGLRTNEQVHIVRGLAPGDTVLINGLLQLKDQQDVAIRQLLNP